MTERTASAQSRSFAAEVERSAPGWLDRYLVPDAAVAIIVDEDVVHTTSFGDAQGDVFEVASLSKTATSLAILLLVEDGKLDLDRPVNDYLRRWQVTSDRFDVDGVTTRRLLNHTSGLPFGFPTDRPSTYPDIVDVLEGNTTVAAAEVQAEPGTRFTYSNPGFGVLELLVEEVTGRAYTKAMRGLVFDPLGMDDTGFQDDERLMERVVPGFQKRGEPAERLIRFPRAAGGMLSTARDIGRLLIGVSRPKDEGGLLEQKSLEEMRALDEASKNAFGLSDGGYALGIAQAKLPSGDLFVANNGSHEGYNVLMLAVPNQRTGFVVLTNAATGLGLELELALSWFDRVAGERPRIASRFSTFRTGMRLGTIALLVLSLLFLVRVGLGVRGGSRAWPGDARWQKLVLKTVPLTALGAGLFAVFDTGLVTSMLGGLEPARFISSDYRFIVGGLAASVVAIGVAATGVPKRSPD